MVAITKHSWLLLYISFFFYQSYYFFSLFHPLFLSPLLLIPFGPILNVYFINLVNHLMHIGGV